MAQTIPGNASSLLTEESGEANPSTARVNLQALLRQHPNDAEAWCALGLLEGRLHDYKEAEQDLRRSVALNPNLAKAHYLLGLSLVANPRWKLDWNSAIAEFRMALALHPDDAASLDYLGVGLTATGQNVEAVTALRRVVRLAPGLASAHFNLGLALATLDETADALSELRKAYAVRADFPEAHSAAGKLLLRTGDRDGALTELREALRENPDLQDAHYAFGQALRGRGQIDEANAEFAVAAALAQREPDGVASTQKSNAAMKEAASGSLARAERLLRQAIFLRPDYGVPHYNLGLILADESRWSDAISQLAQAASLMPAKAVIWFDLGRVLRRAGRTGEGMDCLRWAAALAPDDARISSELHQSAPQGAVSDEGMPRQPSFGSLEETMDAHWTYATALGLTGDAWGQIGELLRALTFSPAAVGPRLELAETYSHVGERTKSFQEYRKVLLVDPLNASAKLP